MKCGAQFRTVYECVCRDKNGKVKWTERVQNLVVDEGLNQLLSDFFTGSNYTAEFYVGLVDNDGFTAIAAGNTAAKITLTANPPTTNGWQECDDYASATVRPAAVFGAAAAKSIGNSASPANYEFDTSATIKGAFLIQGEEVIGATTGGLYGAAAFTSPRAVEEDETLDVTITITAADAG